MSDVPTLFLGLGGSGFDLIKRLAQMLFGTLKEDSGSVATHPPRSLGVYYATFDFHARDKSCEELVLSRKETFHDVVRDLSFTLDKARRSKRRNFIFIHVDDVIDPLLESIKTSALINSERRLLHEIARDATGAGCGAYLAWTAGELLNRGGPAARTGTVFLKELARLRIDEQTRTLLALMPDLTPNKTPVRPLIPTSSLRRENIAITTTILGEAERAMRWFATWDSSRPQVQQLRPLFENELFGLRRCMVDDEPLLRWLGLSAMKLVLNQTCRSVSGMRETEHAPFIRLLVDWIIRDVGTDKGTSIFAASRILPLLWTWFPQEMPVQAARGLERADVPTQLCMISGAFEAFETAWRMYSEFPDFTFEGEVRYAPPKVDSWKEFGPVIARAANQNKVVRSLVEMKMTRLRLSSRRNVTQPRELKRPKGELRQD